MSKFKLYGLVSAICLMGVIFYGWVGFSQSPKSTVLLTTEPRIEQILPFEAETTAPLGSNQPQSPVRLKLSAQDAAGMPLSSAKIHLQIFTPPKTPWFSTDFPIVEGTKLLDIEAIAPQGELQLEQILPIRGTYQLSVNVTPTIANAFTPIQQTFTIAVRENWLKYRHFGILAAILLVVGLGGGLVIGGKQQIQPGEIVPERVRLLLSAVILVAIATLLIVNISAESAHSHSDREHRQLTHQDVLQSQGVEARLLGDVQATVGKPAFLAVQVIDTKTNQPVSDVLLNIKATQLEDNWLAFAYQGVADEAGKLKWQQQFFDGAPHKLEVEVSPQPGAVRQFQSFQISKEIDVEGVEPPLHVRLISLAYFTGILVLGLLLGLWIRSNHRALFPSR